MSWLLDTHALLWWLLDDPRLDPDVAARLDDPASDVTVSVATFWETVIKRALGKLDAPDDLEDRVRAAAFDVLPVEVRHTSVLRRLAPHHGDPFDRMLLAQADAEGLVLVTRDPAMAAYDVPLRPC